MTKIICIRCDKYLGWQDISEEVATGLESYCSNCWESIQQEKAETFHFKWKYCGCGCRGHFTQDSPVSYWCFNDLKENKTSFIVFPGHGWMGIPVGRGASLAEADEAAWKDIQNTTTFKLFKNLYFKKVNLDV